MMPFMRIIARATDFFGFSSDAQQGRHRGFQTTQIHVRLSTER
jgi:hypothetical protein